MSSKALSRKRNFRRAPAPKALISPCVDRLFWGTPTKTNQALSIMTVLTNDVPIPQAAQLPNNAGHAEFQRKQSTVATEPWREVQTGWKTLHETCFGSQPSSRRRWLCGNSAAATEAILVPLKRQRRRSLLLRGNSGNNNQQQRQRCDSFGGGAGLAW